MRARPNDRCIARSMRQTASDPEEWPVSSSDATMTTAGAAESVGGGEAVGMPSLRQAAGGLAAALSQGTTVAREATRLGLELIRIARGRSDVAPAKGDRRFTDPAWTSNPVFRMIGQSYLASAQALDRVVDALARVSNWAVLLPGPATRAQLRRVRHRLRPADVPAQLAQPHPGAGPLGPGHLRPGGAGGD